MPQSLSRVVVHLVFSTKNRTPWLRDAALRDELYKYMGGILVNAECPPILIGGVEDHVHVLCNLSRKLAIMNLVEEIKTEPSKWLKTKRPDLAEFHWQAGYGAFSVSQSNVESVKTYIANQEQHHKKMSFQDEFRKLCERHGIDIDEKYVWD
jgi:REP-associated tyrosine transposase